MSLALAFQPYRPDSRQLTFGAVVLTLNATGCALLFVIWRERLTDWVNGPRNWESAERQNVSRAAREITQHSVWRDRGGEDLIDALLNPRTLLGLRETDIFRSE